MGPNDIWLKYLESQSEKYNKFLVTQSEFEEALNELIKHPHCPLEAVFYEITCAQPFETISLGNKGSGNPANVNTVPSLDLNGSQCEISLWLNEVTSGVQQDLDLGSINKKLELFLKSFWKFELRDRVSNLISYQYPVTKQIANESIIRSLENSTVLCAFSCDIDNFKSLNDALGLTTGDRVILELASILDKTVRPNGIALHRSGDEFTILYPAQAIDDALFLAYNIMSTVSKYNFKVDPHIVCISIGITSIDNHTKLISYETIENRALKALKPGGVKIRKLTRLYSNTGTKDLPKQNEFSRNLAFCVLKSGIETLRPFANPWLNLISRYTCDFMKDKEWSDIDIEPAINELIQWITPELNNNIICTALAGDGYNNNNPIFSPIDIALAVAHGIFRSRIVSKEADVSDKSLQIRFSKEQNACELCLMPENIILIKYGKDGDALSEVLDLGGFHCFSSEDQVDPIAPCRALLIKIGHFELDIPTSIFAELIVVDDRPTRGGGLPDFWEATIARLISHVEKNPNIDAVYIIGNHQYGLQTIEKLQDISSWEANIEEIAYKTGMPINSIKTAIRMLTGKIILPPDNKELISHLANVLKQSYNIKTPIQPAILRGEQRFLQREMLMDSMALEQKDECRVKTIAEAYPVVLDMVRKVRIEEIIKDQAGQELQELIDFKVHLTNPNSSLIPTFYEDERNLFEDYFKREFLSTTGLFGKKFQETKQINAVLDHIVTAISDKKQQFATRRAVLIVPHEIKEGHELAPLGLISIRIIPRFVQSRIYLHYSYTWRTVEALVGFPYSIYGSVKFSQYLTSEIINKLPPEYKRQIEMDQLSYIAHSLHIVMDQYSQNIARRIVDDASV